MEKQPLQMLACQGRLLQLYNEARDRKPPEMPTLRTLFNTWNSIVKRHNRTQSLIDGETLKSGRSHGLFSYTFVREMCKNLGLKPSLTGSKEPADATPEDVDAFVSEVPKLFRDYKIDPRANLQFDEFNDINVL